MVDNYGRWYPDYPGQQPYQDPVYMQRIQQQAAPHVQQPAQQAPVSQDMTPVIRTEMQQVKSIEAIDSIPMGAGESRMFMTQDEKAIIIRSMFANGQHSDRIYDERPPAPPAPKFDPAEYVRRDEVDQLIREALAAYIAAAKKEEK